MRRRLATFAILPMLAFSACKKNNNPPEGIFTGKPAMVDVMPSPKPVAHELPKDTAEPKTQPAKPETEKIVLPIHIEKRLGEGFKKHHFSQADMRIVRCGWMEKEM